MRNRRAHPYVGRSLAQGAYARRVRRTRRLLEKSGRLRARQVATAGLAQRHDAGDLPWFGEVAPRKARGVLRESFERARGSTFAQRLIGGT